MAQLDCLADRPDSTAPRQASGRKTRYIPKTELAAHRTHHAVGIYVAKWCYDQVENLSEMRRLRTAIAARKTRLLSQRRTIAADIRESVGCWTGFHQNGG